MQMFSLNNRVAVVTGGSRGIGKAIALGLSAAGAKVAIAARNLELLNEVAGEIRNNGGEVFSVKCDLKEDSDLTGLIKVVVGKYGRIDILVNNAGINPYVVKSEELKKEHWDEIIRINLTAPFLLCQEAGRNMLKNKWGRIINVASVGGIVGLPRQLAYSVTKGGLIQMTRVLSTEWCRNNITVNAIAPGYIFTDLTGGILASKAISGNLLVKIPVGRFGEASEVVGAAVYLASESSKYTTGATIVIDGGWTAT